MNLKNILSAFVSYFHDEVLGFGEIPDGIITDEMITEFGNMYNLNISQLAVVDKLDVIQGFLEEEEKNYRDIGEKMEEIDKLADKIKDIEKMFKDMQKD